MNETGAYDSFIADIIHDCLSSFQGLDHSDGVCCFDRDGAVAYLLSEASGLRIVLADDDAPNTSPSCFCGQPDDKRRVHRAHACEAWSTPANADSEASS